MHLSYGEGKGVHKIMPYAILLFHLLSCKEKVSFASKELLNICTMCEMFAPESSRSGAAPQGKVRGEVRGSDS